MNKSVKSDPFGSLLAEVRALIVSARRGAAAAVNTLQVMTNYEIGRCIVEHEQKGEHRAEYGNEVVKALALVLTSEFGPGFSATNLKLMRKFYTLFRSRIGQTPSDLFLSRQIGQTASDHLPEQSSYPIQQIASAKWTKAEKAQKPSPRMAPDPAGDFRYPFNLSWSHYVLLLSIKDADERSFFEIEAARENWSLSELKRQKASALYERLALSRDKNGVKQLAEKGQMQMYVNFYDRQVKLADEIPTIGLLLCKENKNAIVELTLPRDANIHARECQLYLPSKELLKQKLLEWISAEEARRA